MSIGLFLKANNSSGSCKLFIDQDDGLIFLCLVGEHNGEPMQIDFDGLTKDDAEDLMHLLRRRIDAIQPTQHPQGESNEQ